MNEFTPLPREFGTGETEFVSPGKEFSQPGAAPEPRKPSRLRVILKRLLLTGGAAIIGLSLLGGARTALPGVTAVPSPSPTTAPTTAPGVSPSPSPAPTTSPTPSPTPGPTGNKPVIETVFFSFSHEHYGRVYITYPGDVHSVRVRVRETVLDIPVYEYYLTEEDVESGVFELPMLSTGDVFMDHYDEFTSTNIGLGSWPEFEMTVDVWYGSEDGSGEEERFTIVREADFELGFGFSYMDADYTWSEVIPKDCFYVSPWEEVEEIRYVIDDPDAVTNPLTVSVDISYNGRHASPEDYETVIERSEYDLIDPDTGERTPTVSLSKRLVLRRPDWIPEEGTVHVRMVQYLASTGEQWVREFDYDYPESFDWDE